MDCPKVLTNDWWSDLYRRSYAGAHDSLERLCQKADRFHLGRWSGGDVFQSFFLNACLCLPYLLFDRYRCRIVHLVQRVLDFGAAELPDFSNSINLSRLYPLAHIVFLASLFVPRARLPVLLGGGIVVLGVAGRLFDPISAVVLLAFVSAVYLLVKANWASRSWKLAVVVIAYLLFMNACQLLDRVPESLRWPSSDTPVLVSLSRFGPGFIPLLWYACYDICAGRLGYAACNLYLSCRFLLAPVFPSKDLCFDWDERRRWQWRGLFTLGMAFVGLSGSWLLERYLEAQEPAWHLSSGLALIWYSYCYYLSLCFGLVARFNMFVGWARMFGVPIKNAFYFWLLARTPNERWQRWNILFREWIITYVFYPMMRAKRGLFLSIMVTLLMSGVIHLLGSLTPDRFDIGTVWRTLFYWALNGLAIYIVILIPRKFPELMDRLRVRVNVLWSVVGIGVTASYYSTLFAIRDTCLTPGDILRLLQRLVYWG